MKRPLLRLFFALFLASVLPVTTPARAAPRKAVPGLHDLAEALVRRASYLLAPNERVRARELFRQLREEERARRSGEEDPSGRTTTPVEENFLQLLADSPAAVRLPLAATVVSLPGEKPISAPGDVGAILLRLAPPGADAKPGNLSCAVLEYDLAGESTRSASPYEMPLDVGGETTWALVTLENVPAKRTDLVVTLKAPGRTHYLRCAVQRQPPGRVRVRIVDNSGTVVPAMVRLRWTLDGVARRPAGAVEFAPRFDSQGSPSAERRARLPGRLSGSYWCVTEPFDMVAATGEWEVTVRRGLEYIPVFDTFTVQPGETIERVYSVERWIDMRARGWYSGDDHVHFQLLSDHDAEALLAWLRAEDIHLANVVKMGDINRTWFEQRGWGPEHRVIADDFILSPGQECPRTHRQLGHTVHMNTTSMVRNTDHYYLYDRVFDEVRRQGGLVGYAHVDRNLFHVARDMSMNVPRGKADFVEILQFGSMGTATWYEFLNLGFPLTASAGSDVPWGGTVGEVRVYAYVGDEDFSADAWFGAFKRGRTFVTNGPLLEFSIDQALPGDTIRTERDRTLRLKARAIGHKERSLPRRLEVIQHGRVIASIEASDDDQTELRIEQDIPVAHGSWIAVRARGRDGSEAHTTPIYVVRKSLRFWDHAGASALIATRRANLDEIESIVQQARRDVAAGEHLHDRWIVQLAKQGDALLERVQAARKYYVQLEATHAAETALRKE